MLKKLIPVFGFALITFIFFWQVFIKGLMPIPSDTVVGLYYPYRDMYVKDYSNGIPFKNFLITDPVRQQYPWRNLSIDSYKDLEIPTWNPYSFSGTPNLANFQSAVFYPLNILLFVLSFEFGWTFLIMLQPFLAGIFLYFYLRNLKLDEYSSFLGGVIFAFSGFFATWLEWGTILHTALWLPLILLSTDKISEQFGKTKIKQKSFFLWIGIFIFSLISSFFAGHLQTFFYLFIFSVFYIFLRIYQSKKRLKLTGIFLASGIIFAIISSIQSLPSLKFILLSGRGSEVLWKNEGWFIPYKHLIQFFIPDFYGNPSTLNYWGTWNYGELTGFVGIVGITLALFAVLFRRDKKTFLFGLTVLITLIVALPNLISKIPFIFNLPFISTSQPTRILFITDFSLSVLAALGLNYFINKGKLKQILIVLGLVGGVLFASFILLQFGKLNIDQINLMVSKRNIFVPIAVLALMSIILVLHFVLKKKINNYLIIALIALTVIELFRFSWKFNTFSKPEYLYPESTSIKFLNQNTGNYRIATADSRILAPNFSVIHKLNSVEGYDPLYIDRYAEFISAINRNEPNINPPFGFNRIIRVENFNSNLVDLLGVKYVLSLSDLKISGFEKVFSEGSTIVYENKEVLPRAFFVTEALIAQNKNDAINKMFSKDYDPKKTAVLEENVSTELNLGSVKIVEYKPNKVVIKTENNGEGFLVLADSFYPTWRVRINGTEQKIYRTDFNFRGIVVPSGDNEIVFENKIL